MTKDEFFAADPGRAHSHVLSYGSGWRSPWTDSNHVIEVMWFGHTHEIVEYHITYDWSRVGPGRLVRDVTLADLDAASVDSGAGMGRLLADQDLAISDVEVAVLGKVKTALICHELLWDWRWLQHHPDGLAEIEQRISTYLSEHPS